MNAQDLQHERQLIALSAYADGELGGHARTELEAELARRPELRAELQLIKQLDVHAAKLPVPDVAAKLNAIMNAPALRDACTKPLPADWLQQIQRVPDVKPERFATVWKAIAARTVLLEGSDAMRASALADGELAEGGAALSANSGLATEMALWKKLDAAAANLPVPNLHDLTERETARAIAARIHETQRARYALSASAESPAAVPQVSKEKWDGVWKKIETRVSERSAAPTNIVPLPTRKVSRWRWMTGAAVAAVVLVALLLKFYPHDQPPPDEGVALDIPKSVNERYDITVEYVKGDPVVCYYLKPEARLSDANRDWRWLPD